MKDLRDFILRDIQEDAIRAIRSSLRAGHRRVVAHLATASGKTVLAGYIFRLALEKDPIAKCAFVVPRIVLAEQAAAELKKHFGLDCTIVQGDRIPDLGAQVIIATVQTLHRRLTSQKPSTWEVYTSLPVKVCAIDECHLRFEGYKTIMDAWDPVMIGLSATPFSRGMAEVWDDMVRPRSMADLIKDGTLCDYRVKAATRIDRGKLVRLSSGEYSTESVESETTKIVGDVFREWRDSDDMRGRQFMGFCQSIKEAVAMCEHFNRRGGSCAVVHSRMSDIDVQARLDAFRAGHYDGLWSVTKLTEGFDYPAVSAILDCAPHAPSSYDRNVPASPARYVQKIGRGLRSSSGKEYCLIHDHAGNFKNFGPVEYIEDLFPELLPARAKPKKMDVEQRAKRVTHDCSKCGESYTGGRCPVCGHKPSKPTEWVGGEIEWVEGRLVEIKKADGRKKGRISLDDKQRIWDAALYTAKAMGRKVGAAAHIYREQTGVWPRRLERLPSRGGWQLSADEWLKMCK